MKNYTSQSGRQSYSWQRIMLTIHNNGMLTETGQARTAQQSNREDAASPGHQNPIPSTSSVPSPYGNVTSLFFSLRSYGDVSISFEDDLSFCSCVACVGCSIIYGKNSPPCDSAGFMQPTVLKCSCLSVCLHMCLHVQFQVANLHSIMFNYKCISLVA